MITYMEILVTRKANKYEDFENIILLSEFGTEFYVVLC